MMGIQNRHLLGLVYKTTALTEIVKAFGTTGAQMHR
jgi:hypothetical protein